MVKAFVLLNKLWKNESQNIFARLLKYVGGLLSKVYVYLEVWASVLTSHTFKYSIVPK